MSVSPASSPESPLPREIGGYRIQRVLGTGGMATVYAALQRRPRRTVALKVMKAGVAGDLAIRRFKREVEILGRLRHPGIAQIFESGTHIEAGHVVPYFVMEYVPGARTILEFAAERELDRRARLKLFVRVCAAVQHGHRNKIIHRDLKPSNILVDRAGDPKVIDFGIARATEVDLSSQTMHTEVGRLVGTIQYMSPEQLETGAVDLNPRCDVYALGAVLYRLLTGELPHDLQGLPVFTAAEIIRREAPRRPGAIRPELAGDLETIMLKAVEKDRSRRYRDAGSLGRDIIRFLAAKPIHARRAGLAHRGRLFVRRHRGALAAATTIVAIMTVAAGAVVWERLRPRSEQLAIQAELDRTQRERAELEAALAARRNARSAPAPEPYTLDRHTGRVNCLAFDVGGGSLASGSNDRTVIRWDLADRRAVFTETGHDASVRGVAFSSAGTETATIADDGALIVLDAEGTWIRHELSTGCGGMRGLAMSPEGERVVFACDDLTLRLWHLDPARERFTERASTGAFTTAAFSADGRRVLTGAARGTVHVWEWAPSAGGVVRIGRLTGLESPVLAVAFVHETGEAAAVAEDGSAMIWNLADGASRRLKTLDHTLVAAQFDASGRWLACAAFDAVVIWEVTTGARVAPPFEHIERVTTVAITHDGTWYAAGEASGRIQVVPITAAGD